MTGPSEVGTPVLAPGDRVGAFTIRQVLRAGAIEDVYVAEQTSLGRRVAVALVRRLPHPSFDRRFEEGIKVVAAASNPHLAQILDAGQHEGCRYVVLEHVDGPSLGNHCGGGLQLAVVLRIASSLAGALHRMHELGVLHLDVRPENVLLRKTGDPVLVGFSLVGIASALGSWEAAEGVVVGTPVYMAPERFAGVASNRCDIWSLGVSLFELLSGRRPWSTRSLQELVTDIRSRPVDLGPLLGRTPEPVVHIIARCLERDPEQRFTTAGQLKNALDGAISYLEHRASEEMATASAPEVGLTTILHVEHREEGAPGAFREIRLGERLGKGTYGEVYAATEVNTGRRVAVKILRREWVADGDAVERFRREAEILAGLSHPNVVRIHNYGRYGSGFFIVMELLEGGTLEAILRARAPLAVSEALSWARSLFTGLVVQHQAGIVHRDLKPANLAIRDDQVVLFDFGMARSADVQTLTASGAFLGSPAYVAPEQIASARVTVAADIYAAGVILYEMLTGSRPHTGANQNEHPLALLARIQASTPVPLSARRAVPEEVERFVMALLAREPDSRPTAAQALEEVGKLLAKVHV